MNSLGTIIVPVLQGMNASHLKDELLRAFPRHAQRFHTIEAAFRRLTARRHDVETLRGFFQSWSQTNNSAMTVAGIGNRLTLLVHARRPISDEAALLRALVSLNRIVDEDLAVTHRVLHAQMFYAMATGIVGDDLWLLHRYIHPNARAFKAWKDHNSLRDPDPAVALLTTLVHEIYTHGEVEFILPLFKRWLTQEYGFTERASTRTLGWISVHCGATEKNHFFHALDAIGHFARALRVDFDAYPLDGIVGTYLEKKAALMEQLCQAESLPGSQAAHSLECTHP